MHSTWFEYQTELEQTAKENRTVLKYKKRPWHYFTADVLREKAKHFSERTGRANQTKMWAKKMCIEHFGIS